MPPYTFFENIANDVRIPEAGMETRTVLDDEWIKVIAFGFAAGHEMAAHRAPMATLLYIVRGEAVVTLGVETMQAGPGSLVHMEPKTPHGIFAKTPMIMLLLMLKQARGEIRPE